MGDCAGRERREGARAEPAASIPSSSERQRTPCGKHYSHSAMLPGSPVCSCTAACSCPASASAAPRVEHLKFKYGPRDDQAGAEHDLARRRRRPEAQAPGLDRRLPPQPRAGRTARSRASTCCTCTTRSGSSTASLTFAAGEEKTNVRLPKGFGWRHEPDDAWVLNHMIHNLLPNRDRVYLTYTLDFIPDSSPAAKGIRPVKTRWLDVEGGKAYPVFDVHRGSGRGRALHLPRRRARRLRRPVPAQPDADPARRRARPDRRPPAPGRPLHRPQAHARRAHGQPLPLAGAVLGARRARCRGTSR